MPSNKISKTIDFEKSLSELEKIVERMEQGEQSLDQTIKDFERGMTLSKKCQESLDNAQQKVDKLVDKHGDYKLKPLDTFDNNDNNDNDNED